MLADKPCLIKGYISLQWKALLHGKGAPSRESKICILWEFFLHLCKWFAALLAGFASNILPNDSELAPSWDTSVRECEHTIKDIQFNTDFILLLMMMVMEFTLHCILSFLLFSISCDSYFLVKALIPNFHLSLNHLSSKRDAYFESHHPPLPSYCKMKIIQVWGKKQSRSLCTTALPMNTGRRSKNFWQSSRMFDSLIQRNKNMGHFQTVQ